LGAPCNYAQGIEQDGSMYIAFTDEAHDDGRNVTAVKVSPSPEPNRFYIWPRRRDLAPYVCSEPPDLVDVDGRRCLRFRDTGTAGVDVVRLDLAEGDRLELRLDVKVVNASPAGQCVLLSFGDTAPGGSMPIRIGGPGLASGKLNVSTGTDWREGAAFALGEWHRLSVVFTAANVTIQVDDRGPLGVAVPPRQLNPRLYLGEGVIVGDVTFSRGFEFVIDLTSLRTQVKRER